MKYQIFLDCIGINIVGRKINNGYFYYILKEEIENLINKNIENKK